MSGFIHQTIGDWTPAELQSFMQNVVQLEPSQLPPSFNVKTLTSADDIVANGVTLSGDPPLVEAQGRRAAGIVPGSDTDNSKTIFTASWTKINFAGGSSIKASYNSTVDNPQTSQWTNDTDWLCPVSGLYSISAGVRWTGNATGTRRIAINSSDAAEDAGGDQGDANDSALIIASMSAPSGADFDQYVHRVMPVDAGTSLSMFVFQNSGGSLDIIVQENFSTLKRSSSISFTIARIGDTSGNLNSIQS